MRSSARTAVRDPGVAASVEEDEIVLAPEEEAELALSLDEADRDEVIPWEKAKEQLRSA
jgi:hypothetical protein